MAVDDDLICNFRKCRKRLKNFAWTTSCSHVFCDEDGTKLFNNRTVCPACETDLPGKYDIVRVDLQPSEEYKSMLLAGHRPETVMEICSRALSFWTYQSHQERIYQEYSASKMRDKLQQIEGYYEQLLSRTQAELSSVKTLIESQRKELESTKLKYNEASEKLMEKNRQHQKLQVMYDALRRRNVTVATFDEPKEVFVPSPQRHISHTHVRQHKGSMVGRMQDGGIEVGGVQVSSSHQQKPGVSVSTSSTVTNIQVDPGLAAAVNAGAVQQNVCHKPTFIPAYIREGDDIHLDIGRNPVIHLK